MLKLAAALKSARPAEKWGGLVALLAVILSLVGIPEMTGLTENEIAGALTGIGLVAAFVRGAYQAHRAKVDPPELREQLSTLLDELAKLRVKVREMDATTRRVSFPEADSVDPVTRPLDVGEPAP